MTKNIYVQPGVLTVTASQSSLLKVLGVFLNKFALTPFQSQQPLTPFETEKLSKSKVLFFSLLENRFESSKKLASFG
jgi:hypothetical protein